MKLLIYQGYLNLDSNSWLSQLSSEQFSSGLLFPNQLGSLAIPSVVLAYCPNTETADKPGHVNGLLRGSGAWLPSRLSPIAQHR